MNDYPRSTAILGTYRKGEMVKLLKNAAALLGARTLGVLFVGMACVQQTHADAGPPAGPETGPTMNQSSNYEYCS